MPEYVLDTHSAPAAWRTLDTFARSYVEAAMWTMTDDGGPCDHLGVADIAPETLDRMAADCAAFVAAAGALLDGADDSQAGHDFWLTRNHHGAGFWDRDPATYPADPQGKALTTLAQSFGETDLYLGDSGHVHHS